MSSLVYNSLPWVIMSSMMSPNYDGGYRSDDAFCRYSKSYDMLFQALIGCVTLPGAAKLKCICLRMMYSIVLIIAACVRI